MLSLRGSPRMTPDIVLTSSYTIVRFAIASKANARASAIFAGNDMSTRRPAIAAAASGKLTAPIIPTIGTIQAGVAWATCCWLLGQRSTISQAKQHVPVGD
jgi:hypothetical protein